MIPALIGIFFLILVITGASSAEEQWAVSPGFGPAYVSDTIPDRLLPGHTYPVMVTFRNNGLVAWEDEMRRIGLLYEGDLTKITAIPVFVEVPPELNITPGKEGHFALTLLPVGIPGSYDLAFSVVMRSAVGDQKITETFTKTVTIVPTDGISSPGNGSVFVESAAPDMKVYLASMYEGNVPAIIADVKPGNYEMRVSNSTFDRTYPIDVEGGSMTRVLVHGDASPPVITKKDAGPISDGTVLGYIEANIPLILIILLIILICGGIGIHGIRTRKHREGEWEEEEEEKKKDEDPEKERLKEEKKLLDKAHRKKPIFQGLDPSSDPGGSAQISAVSTKGGVGGTKGNGSRSSKKDDLLESKSGASGPQTSTKGTPDVEVRVQDVHPKPGSATAMIGVSNRSDLAVTVEDQNIGAGGFGIIPVEIPEPVTDESELIFPLRILAGGSEFFKHISIHYNRGIALLTRGVVEKAYEYFRSLLHNDPGNLEALLEQARILVGWGLEEEADAVLKEILALDPTHEDALLAQEKLQEAEVNRKKNREPDPRPQIPDYPTELSDRYTPIRVLGDDPFATVILVRKNDTGDLRALKIPRKMETIGSSLFTEISLLYQLRHPYVLRMFRAEFSPVVMLELEYVAGGWYDGSQRMSLSDLPIPLPEETWLPLIEKIAEGVAYLHRQGVRHYHLSPRYILLDEPMVPKISGLIRESLRGAGGSGKEEFFVRAPEQIDPQFFGKPGKKTDIFQLGAIWFWMVTGEIIRQEEQMSDSTETRILLSRFDPAYERYDALIQKITARMKQDRYGSVEEFLAELKALNPDNQESLS